MKTFVHVRRSLIPALFAVATPAAFAGEVSVSKIDTATGALQEQVTGTMSHAPAHLFALPSEPLRVTDACGAVHETGKDAYGERSLTALNHSDHSLAKVKLLAVDKYGGAGVGHDGKPWLLHMSDDGRGFVKGDDFNKPHAFATTFETELDFSKTRLFVAAFDGMPHLAFFNDGRLLGVRDLKNEQPQARFIAPKNAWSNVTHAVSTYVGTGRERTVKLITVDNAGQMTVHTPVEEADGWDRFVTSMQSAPVGTVEFTGTKGLFRDSSGEVVYRWTESGDLFAVDIKKGTEKRIGASGAFKGAFIEQPHDDLYLVSQSGSFAPCPKQEAPKVVEAPKKDTSIIAAADEIKALADKHWEAINDAAREEHSFSGDFAQDEVKIKALHERVAAFERDVVTPVRTKVDAFVAKYGDDSEAELKLREATGQMWYMNSRLGWLLDALGRYESVRPAIAAALAHHADVQFTLGEHSVDWSVRSKQYLLAKPWAEWALKFDPQQADAKRMLATADSSATAADAAYKQRIQNAVWPKDVPVNGDAEALKKKVLKYFQQHHQGEDFDAGSRYFAIRVAHDWYVNKTNVLDQPTEWRVSVYIARTVPGDPDYARVYWAEVGTQTGDVNSPFAARYFGTDPYLIPIERVPADDKPALQESLKLISK